MRVVYDDSMQKTFVAATEKFVGGFNVKDVVRYEWGTERVQMHMVKEKLNAFLRQSFNMEIGKTVTHAHGIGNNCQYPVYFYPNGVDEVQQCAYINLNTGMYGEGFLSCEDYNGNRIGAIYEISTWGIKVK